MTTRLQNHTNAVEWACDALAAAPTEGYRTWMIKQLRFFVERSPFSFGLPGLWAATEPLAVAASIASINADRSRLFLGKVWQLKVTGSSEVSHENYPPMRSIHIGFEKDELKDLVGLLSGGDDF